jgi:hypothetical protein
MQFEVQPISIRPGESVTLLWHVENPSTISIGPGLGAVVQRGSRRLTPAATTTYTITVGPPGNAVATRSVTVTVAGTTPVTVTSDSTATRKPVPRTRDGKPDLTGVYDFRAPAGAGGGAGGARGAAANAPAAAPGSVARTPTLKPGMESFRVVRGPFDVGGTCLPSLPPGSFGSPYQFQIIQNKDVVLIFYEYPGTFRIIPIDGEPHPVDPDPSWMGDSVGRWEGDILVVDTIGYNDKTVVSGHRHTEALHTIERFRRTEEALELEVTIEDPNVFVGPWTETRSFRYMPELKKIGEFICENNRDYSPLFGTPVPESQNPRVGVPR